MTFRGALAKLTAKENLVKVRHAEQGVSPCSGLYSIYVDRADALPSPFSVELKRRSTCLMYLGIARRSLLKRLIQQDLRHQSPSTFFRGIGAVLGYRPPIGSLRGMANQRNYKFSQGDTGEIIHWIDDHLLVSWYECEATSLSKIERCLIRHLIPLMNSTHNPARSEVLASLRKECREIATSKGRRRDGYQQ